jgi:hypothetical protein
VLCDEHPADATRTHDRTRLSSVSVTNARVRTAAAAASCTVLRLISGPVRRAGRIAAFPRALYLRLATGELIALLSRDAVRMPFGLALASSSAQLPLDQLRGPVLVGAGEVGIGDWSVWVSRLISVAAPVGLVADRTAVERAWETLNSLEPDASDLPELGVVADLEEIGRLDAALAHRMLGVGPGLTPAGDDFLAGLLVGARSFGLAAQSLRAMVAAQAPYRTTVISAALLRGACRGESLPELTRMLLSLSGRSTEVDSALDALVKIGHTSGRALAAGALSAATIADGRVRTEVKRAGRTSLP